MCRHGKTDCLNSEVADKGKSKSTEEEKAAVEAEADPEDEPESLIVSGKRRRKDVDYSKVGRPAHESWLMSRKKLGRLRIWIRKRPTRMTKMTRTWLWMPMLNPQMVSLITYVELMPDDEAEFVDNGEDAEGDDDDDDEDEEK